MLILPVIRLHRWLLGAAIGFGVSACAPPLAVYKPPELDDGPPATIVGSRLEVSHPLSEDIRVLISAVNAAVIKTKRGEWATPIKVPPGSHVIQIVAVQGDVYGEAAMRVTLEPGRAYVARFSRGESGQPGTIWLEDLATSAAASAKIPVFTWF